ncbi:hypothetical protein AB1Y20_023683 [Prymnesium parvum]|uniref:Uncharacterized protein n=1 Tax=Prymnesium parvum TaxID=97485 RepID=A0AB34JGZ0_PRYPA
MRWLAGTSQQLICFGLLAALGLCLDEEVGDSPHEEIFNYYAAVRLALLGTLLIVGTHMLSVLYLRWSIGTEAEEARDGLTFIMCSIAHSVAWSQALLLLLRLSGLFTTWSMQISILQYCSSLCLWVLTPFAYLYHEAVGIGHSWGTTGVAARGIEAAMLLVLLTILVQGFFSVLNASTTDDSSLFVDTWSLLASKMHLEPRNSLHRLVSFAGTITLLFTAPRGALCPIAVCGSSDVSPSRRAGLERSGPDLQSPAIATTSDQVMEADATPRLSSESACESPSLPEQLTRVASTLLRLLSASVSTSSQVRRKESLLAQPFPARSSKLYVSARKMPIMAAWLFALLAWGATMLVVVLRLRVLLATDVHAGSALALSTEQSVAGALGADAATAGRADEVSASASMLSTLADGSVSSMEEPPLESSIARPWLAMHFVVAALFGHHLVCQYDVRGACRKRKSLGAQLQHQLLQTAALQVQAASIPVAAHALGMLPEDFAKAHTTLPLYQHPLHATLYCTSFLAVNLVHFALAACTSQRVKSEER